MKVNTFSFSKTVLKGLPNADKGKRYYAYDTRVNGLGIAVTGTGTKSFFVYRKINGKPRRVTLGRFPDLTPEMARKEAQKVIGKIASGIDPVAEKKELEGAGVILREVFDQYLTARKNLKPATLADYRYIMRHSFKDWLNKPLGAITKDHIEKRHALLGKRSQARANNAMRLMRALFNFAGDKYEDKDGHSLFPYNPVRRLSNTRAWYKVGRRQTVIKVHELPAWFEGLLTLGKDGGLNKAHTVRDYLLLILFTGLRKSEAARLKWPDIDIKAKTITATDTKNGEAHTLPLPDFIFSVLARRKLQTNSEYIFPGTGKLGYLVEPRRQMDKVTEHSGVKFGLHDLRRTFITIAESLDISSYALKRLLNHKMQHDVTAGYIVSDIDRLREPMQQISDKILQLAEFTNKEQIESLTTGT